MIFTSFSSSTCFRVVPPTTIHEYFTPSPHPQSTTLWFAGQHTAIDTYMIYDDDYNARSTLKLFNSPFSVLVDIITIRCVASSISFFPYTFTYKTLHSISIHTHYGIYTAIRLYLSSHSTSHPLLRAVSV